MYGLSLYTSLKLPILSPFWCWCRAVYAARAECILDMVTLVVSVLVLGRSTQYGPRPRSSDRHTCRRTGGPVPRAGRVPPTTVRALAALCPVSLSLLDPPHALVLRPPLPTHTLPVGPPACLSWGCSCTGYPRNRRAPGAKERASPWCLFAGRSPRPPFCLPSSVTAVEVRLHQVRLVPLAADTERREHSETRYYPPDHCSRSISLTLSAIFADTHSAQVKNPSAAPTHRMHKCTIAVLILGTCSVVAP